MSTTPQDTTSETSRTRLPQVDPEPWPSLAGSGSGLPLHIRPQACEGPPTSSLMALDQSKVPDQSSTNVDFVTYSRSDVTDISVGALLREKDEYTQKQALVNTNLSQNHTKTCLDSMTANTLSPAARSVEVYHLQSLLPHKYQVLHMVDYHDRCMNYWTGGL
jgi:hypothetical protein